MLNVLIIGSGGREHAMAQGICQSKHIQNLYIMPGNPGTATVGTNLNCNISDFGSIKQIIIDNKIDIIVSGPEAPLADGLMDYIDQEPWEKKPQMVGPKKYAAQLESSKEFAKEFMMRHNIPTAKYRSFSKSNIQDAYAYIDSLNEPIVLKADGLAGGKGVIISSIREDAKKELAEMLDGKFGNASRTVIIEEFLQGIEFSIFVVTDGKDFALLPEAKDYKKIGEGDTGLNTGGMGAISPVPFFDKALKEKVLKKIVEPTINGLNVDQIEYKGFLFFGLISVQGEPYVIEYNVRMGDPESESVFPRIDSDLLDLFLAIENGNLKTHRIKVNKHYCTTVVVASGGYPQDIVLGKKIILPEIPYDGMIFHSGTKIENDELITNGGRVLAVTAFGKTKKEAITKSNVLAQAIQFEGKYYRTDIGFDLG